MSNINHYIANSTGELTKLTPQINEALDIAIPLAIKKLDASNIDIIFVSAAALTIPEYGIGGNSPGPNHIYVSLDPDSEKITKNGLVETILHEVHHCMRWRGPGYGSTLGEAIVSEGLACLFEEEYSNKPPMYANVRISSSQIKAANEELKSKNYNHSEWFFGTGKVTRWFGYTYGYKLCKQYAKVKGLTAGQMVEIPANDILSNN